MLKKYKFKQSVQCKTEKQKNRKKGELVQKSQKTINFFFLPPPPFSAYSD